MCVETHTLILGNPLHPFALLDLFPEVDLVGEIPMIICTFHILDLFLVPTNIAFLHIIICFLADILELEWKGKKD